MDTGENFGQRMTRLKQERGLPMAGPGRPRIADKYKKQIAATEQAFATAMPAEAQRYIDNLAPQEPEECPIHRRRLACPIGNCPVESERIPYNHKAASYVFDRVMGKPTTRSENTVTVRLVDELVTAFVTAFSEVNGLDDADTRRQAFVARCAELGAQYAGPTAA